MLSTNGSQIALRLRFALCALAILGLGLAPAPSARAAVLEISFTGTTTLVDAALFPTFAFGGGEAVSGTIVWDTDGAVDSAATSLTGIYQNAISSFELTVGSYNAVLDPAAPPNNVQVDDNLGADGVSWFDDLAGPDAGGSPLSSGLVKVVGPTSWLSSDAIIDDPAVFSLPGLVGSGQLAFTTAPFTTSFVKWSLTSFQVTAVPAPPPGLLLGLSFGALTVVARVRRSVR